MAAGDVTVEFIAISAGTLVTRMEALRVTANDKWLLTTTGNGQQLVLAHIEEA